jgi:hypothetical protein
VQFRACSWLARTLMTTTRPPSLSPMESLELGDLWKPITSLSQEFKLDMRPKKWEITLL